MKLENLLNGVEDAVILSDLLKNQEVSGLAYDSRKVKPGDIFFAIKGFEADGRKFITNALTGGANVVVIDDVAGISSEIKNQCVLVKDVRKAMATVSCNFYRNPSRELKLIGITGTNGKSSIGQILASIFEAAGERCAILGTIECRHPGGSFVPERTTMEATDIQRFLREAMDHGCTTATMEVSAHSLSLFRVWGCEFSSVLFTNLTPDHQDFYPTMQEYYEAKKMLFAEYASPATILCANVGSEWGRKLSQQMQLHCGYSVDKFVDGFENVKIKYDGSELVSQAAGISGYIGTPDHENVVVKSNLVGKFNIENILAATAVAHSNKIDPKKIATGIANLRFIPGRLERLETNTKFTIFVDFAHSGAALDNVINAVKEIQKKRLILVFGAGGDKDPMRRVHMGKIAANRTDISIITSDNPRFEDPNKIIHEIEAAFDKEGVPTRKIIEPDRAKAIRIAVELANDDDIILITGKGHEQGQSIKGKVLPFSDQREAVLAVKELTNV